MSWKQTEKYIKARNEYAIAEKYPEPFKLLKPDFKSSATTKSTMKKKVTQSLHLDKGALENILRKAGGFSQKATIVYITKQVPCEGSMVDPRDPCYETIIEGVKISEESEIDIR